MEKMDQNRILEDAKELLRATLISKKHGVQQSKLEQEYEDLTVGEKIPWKKLGFPNLFEFLISVPDVAKLEWRKEDEDNRVFAVLDKGTYTSFHAKKMSVKGFGRGSKALSPEEIYEWKQANGSSKSESDVSKGGKNSKSRRKKNNKKTVNATKTANKTNVAVQATFDRNLGELNVADHVPKSESANDSYRTHVMTSKENGELNNGSDISDKYKGVLPNAKGLYSLCVKLKNVGSPQQFDKAQALNLVRDLLELPSCTIIESHATSHTLVFVRYRTLRELAIAIEAVDGYQIGDITIDASPAKDRMTTRAPGNAHNMINGKQTANKSLASLLDIPQQQSLVIAPQKPGLLPTPIWPVLDANVPIVLHHPAALVGTQALHPELSATKEQIPAAFIQENGIADQDKKTNVEKDALSGFIITENEFVQMCITGCKQIPKVANDLPAQIKFIITYTEDPCQFWIHLLEQNAAIIELSEQLQAEISNSQLSNAPTQCPSLHQFGAAKYYADELWYRCWVLNCSKERNEICVLFCDYGNYETVPIDNFRVINPSLWSLLPQAIPVRLHGVKLASGSNREKRKEGADKLSSLCIGKLLQADVVKEIKNSKSHIIELKNILVPDCDGVYLEDIMVKLGLLEREINTTDPYSINGVYKQASVHERKNAVHSDSSLVSGSFRHRSEGSISSESTFSNDSYSSCGVKYKPERWSTTSSMSEEGDMQGKDNISVDGRRNKPRLDNGGDISKASRQDAFHRKNGKVQSYLVDPMDDISSHFKTISVRKIENIDVEISSSSPSINHTVSNVAITAQNTRRFRPHTPPLPEGQNLGDSDEITRCSLDFGAEEALISSVRSLQKGHVITDLVNFKQERILNRDLMELEVKRWDVEKGRLQKHIESLKEAVGSSHETHAIILNRNRKKRLELHVKLIAAEKQLEEVTKELNELDMS